MGKKLAFTIINLFIIGTILGLLASFLYLNSRIYPNTYIAGISVGKMTRREALEKINREIAKTVPENIVLVYKQQEWQLPLESISYNPNPEDSVNKAMRGKNLRRLLTGDDLRLNLSYFISEEKLNQKLATLSAQINFPAQKPEINLKEGKVIITPGQDGKQLNIKRAKTKLASQLSQLNFSPVNLPVEDKITGITKQQIEETKKRALRLLDKKLLIKINGQEEELSSENLLSMISFTNGFDKKRTADYVKTLEQKYNSPPQNAAFRIQNGKVVLFKPSRDGVEIESGAAINQIYNLLFELEKRDEKELVVNLELKKTKPEITNADVNNLGIKTLLGRGISYYTGSGAGRIHNLTLAASRINGSLVPPGEVFSFNKTVGDISAATGYQSAYIIKDGRTILGDGGGVCQDSTTLFRAVLDAGLPVVQRHAHSYRVVYYEKGGFKPGLDATVFAPSVDFSFRNDTPAYILIQAYTTPSENKLTYEIYGTSDGRVSKITNHRVWSQTPPPEPLYQDDPTLSAGTVKQIDFAAWGAKAAFDYTVTRDGKTLIERTFYSSFRPWQAVYLRGTGNM